MINQNNLMIEKKLIIENSFLINNNYMHLKVEKN